NGNKIGEAVDFPFLLSWSNIESASYTLTAVATDNTGLQNVSAPIEVYVAEGLIRTNSVWKYLDDGTDAGVGWRSGSFDDSRWRTGLADFGYGGAPVTIVNYGPDDTNRYITTYFRKPFEVRDTSSISNLTLSLKCDHGAI